MTGSYTDASTDAYGLDAYPAPVFATCASTDATESYESGPETTRQSYRTYTPLMNPLLMLPS